MYAGAHSDSCTGPSVNRPTKNITTSQHKFDHVTVQPEKRVVPGELPIQNKVGNKVRRTKNQPTRPNDQNHCIAETDVFKVVDNVNRKVTLHLSPMPRIGQIHKRQREHMQPHTAGVKSSTIASKVPLEYKYLGRCTCVSITVVQCFGSVKRLPTYHPEDSQNIINAALEGTSFYQFPLLFVYGEEGYHKGLKLANSPGLDTKVLYTIEFQKRGLPHCHSLLWLTESTKIHEDNDVDKYICAELPDPATDAEAYRVISELMIHGLCGYANPSATCMKDGSNCNRNLPKPYSERTFIDKDGYVHYRRRETGIDTYQQNVCLDNSLLVISLQQTRHPISKLMK
ncbi:hypothetical protein Tco_1424317 [Tanacetum coccineum]